jgi:hypothetical protein
MWLIAYLLIGFAVGCSGAVEHPAAYEQAVIIGEDNRREVATLSEPERSVVLNSVVALMAGHRLLLDEATSVRINANSLGGAQHLCDGEPFAEQPVAAHCTGVLIESDLVLTAGHCLGRSAEQGEAACKDLRLAFGYAYTAPPEAPRIAPEQVFFCRRVAIHAISETEDFAVLQLDRPVEAPLAPSRIAAADATTADSLLVATTGAGLPIKVEARVRVTQATNSEFLAPTDTFAGSSGGPSFDARLELVGLFRRGTSDWEIIDGCARAAQLNTGDERHQQARRALEALCSSGWPSLDLCRIDHDCGDGICGASERANCAADCQKPFCGDGLCELEERANCDVDCHRYDSVPANWPLHPQAYIDRQEAEAREAKVARGGCAIASPSDARTYLLALALAALRRRCTTRHSNLPNRSLQRKRPA